MKLNKETLWQPRRGEAGVALEGDVAGGVRCFAAAFCVGAQRNLPSPAVCTAFDNDLKTQPEQAP